VGKIIQEQREQKTEDTVEARSYTTSPRLRDILIANRIKVFKFCLLNVCKREYGI
jgi:hypothetical protein